MYMMLISQESHQIIRQTYKRLMKILLITVICILPTCIFASNSFYASALNGFNEENINSLIEKLGRAASCIKTFLNFLFFIKFNALWDDSCLSLPPLITFIDLSWIFFIGRFDTIIIDLNNFDLNAARPRRQNF